jgi:hypothetical protein
MTPAAAQVLELLDFFMEEIEVLEGELAHLGAAGLGEFMVADLKPIRQRVAQAHLKLSGLMGKILQVHRGGKHVVG